MKTWNLTQINQRIYQNALVALEQAYQAATVIKSIEETHFNGDAILLQPGVGKTVTDYFETQLKRQLLKIRTNLLRFQVTTFLVNRQTLNRTAVEGKEANLDAAQNDADQNTGSTLNQIFSEASVLEKLSYIESVVGKYRALNDVLREFFPDETTAQKSEASSAKPIRPEVLEPDEPTQPKTAESTALANSSEPAPAQKIVVAKVKPVEPKRNDVMRLFGGAAKIGKEFSPKYEQEVVQELRVRRAQNRMAVRWLALLLLLPLLIQTLTRHLVLNPVLGSYFDQNPSQVELSLEIEEEFLHKFTEYKEALEVKHLLARAVLEEEQKKHKEYKNSPKEEAALATALFGDLSSDLLKDVLSQQPGKFRSLLITSGWTEVEEELQEKALQEKALELWREAQEEQLNGIKNVLADGTALLAFAGLVYIGRYRIAAIRSFSNRAFLSLNDPTKVFMFILITDMFVGFHSAEGWEVVLEGIAHHFGLPESKVMINGFIATVPVFIDACVKFWIFSYLTRYSPAASAIYERMNT
jgi:hypothetical protein